MVTTMSFCHVRSYRTSPYDRTSFIHLMVRTMSFCHVRSYGTSMHHRFDGAQHDLDRTIYDRTNSCTIENMLSTIKTMVHGCSVRSYTLVWDIVRTSMHHQVGHRQSCRILISRQTNFDGWTNEFWCVAERILMTGPMKFNRWTNEFWKVDEWILIGGRMNFDMWTNEF